VSRLAELLREQREGPATPATSATPGPASSKSSKSSNGSGSKNHLDASLERRLRAMAEHWRYSPAELIDLLDRARLDPVGWLRAVSYDESREAGFRERGLLT
jgi:hypothetical protein